MKTKIDKGMVLFWVAVLVISGTAITSYKSSTAVSQAGFQENQIGDVPTIQSQAISADTSTDSVEPQTPSTNTQVVPSPAPSVSPNVVPNISPATMKPSIKRTGEIEDDDEEFEDD